MPLPPLGRIGLGMVGAVLVVLGVFVIATPRSIHMGRGFLFLLVLGFVLIYLAIRQPNV